MTVLRAKALLEVGKGRMNIETELEVMVYSALLE